jgi:sialate O-acetylesterase
MKSVSNALIFSKRNWQFRFCKRTLFVFAVFSMSFALDAHELKVSNLFTDHMVLQREMPVPIWGLASPGEKISVSFAGQNKTTTANKNGEWKVLLDDLETSKIGRNMTISGKKTITIADILVGEVWICSGQSNMQFKVAAIPNIRALSPFANNIRSFEVLRTVSFKEENELAGKWQNNHPTSAVAFSFAFFLEALGDIPVGIIHASWGSSSIEAWMPRDMTTTLPYFNQIMQDFDDDIVTRNQISAILAKENGWSRKDDVFLRRQPNIVYNAMMKPLAPYAVRGLVWYQGERNARYLSGVPTVNTDNWFHRVAGMQEYGEVLSEWVLRYRREWQNDAMNFMVVMLPGYGKGTIKQVEIDPQSPTAESWAWMRESQLKVLKLPYTHVVNTIDLGDVSNLHPKDKLPIGQRLALQAAKYTLHKDVVAQGPLMKKVEVKGDHIVVHFDNASGLTTSDGKAPRSFWISDETGKWMRAEAKIQGEMVILSASEVKQPVYVRYAFAGKPDVNLINEHYLPAYPFRSN